MNKLIVIRHSERLDEVSKAEWKNILLRNALQSAKKDISKIRSRYSFENDPPITENGKSLARDMANTVVDILRKETNVQIKLFSSKLIRCIQTSYQLALQIGGPIYVSSGLALTAQAVAVSDGDFEFLSIEEIKEYCPGVEIVCCDSPDSSHHIPSSNWLAAVEAVANCGKQTPQKPMGDCSPLPRTNVNLLVAHRETIRNMMNEWLQLPYCCLASFETREDEKNPGFEKLEFQWLIDKDGKRIR